MKYVDIYEKIRELIQQDIYQDGQKIPSLRMLSKTYDCSIETIKHALQLLVDEELIYVKNRSGFYVLQKNTSVPQIPSPIIDFTSTKANETTFPYTDFQSCLSKATENYKQDFFEYGKSQGLPELIETLTSWFTSQQIYTKPENLFITTGVQQALFILSRLSFPNHKSTILIEEPSYHLMLDILTTENIPFFTIERFEHEINWALLEYYFKEKEIKFFYLTPRISNPLGLSYTEEDKKKLIVLANKYDVYLIEDDYLADFVSDSTNQPLHFYDTNEKVIYLKSFSKIMFPGLRIGICLLPSLLISAFQQYRTIMEIDSPMFSQAGLNLYIKSGMFDNHVKQTQRNQKKRNDAFIQAVSQIEDQTLFQLKTFQTYKTFLRLPTNVSMHLFKLNLEKEEIVLDHLTRHFSKKLPQAANLYGIELFTLTPDTISEGIVKLNRAYENSIKY